MLNAIINVKVKFITVETTQTRRTVQMIFPYVYTIYSTSGSLHMHISDTQRLFLQIHSYTRFQELIHVSR